MAASDTSKFTVMEKIPHYREFEWSIDDFSTPDDYLESPQFCAADDCPVKWSVVLDIFGHDLMIIHLETSHNEVNDLKVNFSYKYFIGEKLLHKDSAEDIFPVKNCNREMKLFRPRHYGHYYQKCRIQGHITVYNCCQKRIGKNVRNDVEMTTNTQLQIDFKSLLKRQEFTDVALNVGNEVIRAHKFVLCARSPVFKKIFQHDFKEAVHNSVDVKDMEKSVLENFLEFLYTEVVEDRKFETVTSLYSAADKYGVKTLQEACRKILISSISENTASVILKLADMHNDNDLKEITIVYICNNFVKIELTPEWGHLLDTDPRLASYTLRRVSTKMSK